MLWSFGRGSRLEGKSDIRLYFHERGRVSIRENTESLIRSKKRVADHWEVFTPT